MMPVANLELSYVQSFKDRHGKRRYYFRRPGYKRVSLPSPLGSDAFMVAYQAAIDEGRTEIGKERSGAGSVSALIASFYLSGDFAALKAMTQRDYRCTLEAFRLKHGAKPVAKIEAKHVNAILGELAEKPGAAKKLRHRLRQIMQHAVDLGWRTDNPVLVSKKIKHRSDGFVPWTEEEIAKFEAHWPSGSKPRLALSLLLYTGQRRSDMVRMGQQHVTGSRISVVQVKTGARLMIPIHPALKVEIAQHKDDMTFLRTEYGKPFSVAGFGDWFKDKVTKAEIEGRTAHGLRKAAGRRLAEAGCTAHEIMSILGHVSLNEAQKYTRDVDQQRMADGAIRKLRGTKKERVVSNPSVKP